MATATPTTTTTITSNIPDWAQAAAQKQLGMLYNTTGAIDPSTGKPYLGLAEQGYQQYGGQMTAGFNPLQEQAFKDIAKMQVSPQTMQATGFAGLAGLQAQQAGQYTPYQGPENFYRFRDRSFTQPGASQQFMSPYMQNVVEQQKQQAVQDYARQIPGLQAQGIRSGARGGTREALLQSEAQRNLMSQLGGIQATGLQNAYQQAQQQFNAEQAARQQAAANRAQFGLQGAQLGESSRQFGANLGLQGIQQQLAAAGALGVLGQQQYQQGLGINAAQLQSGAQIQALAQQDLANRYQEFVNQQQFPYKQMEFASGILRGIPSTGQTQTLYQAPGSTLGQIAGLAGGLGSLFGGFGTTGTTTTKTG
jgi:hypothetical protein